ncbi:MAG: signal peptide peptidase SppA [Planctomycetota bacterium]|nr:signal peptide peptidase SppA [Planctomycetota bacterium]
MRLVVCIPFLFLLSGCGTPSLLITPVSNTYELQQVDVKAGKGLTASSKVAIIAVEGTLMDVREGGLLRGEENPLSLFVQELDEAASDDSVKAVVLRVNSPGGSVTCSDVMYDAVLRFKQQTHKPVVASAQEVVASGAYYVSCAADRIVVNPTSVVGSIGVIFETFDLVGTMDKLGVRSEAIKSAELKDMGSPFKHMTAHEREVMQGMVDEYYARFKSVVSSNRPLKDPAMFPTITDGRVFSGARAVELGLADQTGRLQDAIEIARQMASAPKASVIMYKRPFGYSGSIYADASTPEPKSNEMSLKLPLSEPMFPTGFYYLWQP